MTVIKETPAVNPDSDSELAKAAIYAVFARLLTSPFESEQPLEMDAFSQLLHDAAGWIPFTWSPVPLCQLLVTAGDEMCEEYSALFEVGNDGGRYTLSEEQAFKGRGKRKEEIVRYYEHFNFQLKPQRQWRPDHLAVELEFMQFLLMGEAAMSDEQHRLSYQFAQRDFLQRHLLQWLPPLSQKFADEQADSGYALVLAALTTFLQADLAWQNQQLN